VIPLTLGEVAELCPGRLRAAPGAEAIAGVQVDSRRVGAGDLFVAVGAGRAYADDALARGAAAALVPVDAFAALAALGGTVRQRSAARVVGITGSAGKTSTKDILAAICIPQVRTVAAEASFNNEIGVPLTLCRLEPDTDVCVLELAMRGAGQIAELCAFAGPDIGVITNVGPAHVEQLGSVEGIVRAKGELVEALPPGGTAIVPSGFPVVRKDIEVIRIQEAEARVEKGGTVIAFEGRQVTFDFIARHQARNAVAALHAAKAVGVEPGASVEVVFSQWRGDEAPLPGEGLLINDAYNANPLSMRAALENLVDRAEGRRTVAVLGDMAELGDRAPSFHREVGELAAHLGIEVLVGVGFLARHYIEGAADVPSTRWLETADQAKDEVDQLLAPGDVVLVKASRSMGLEAVALALAAAKA
jgi:UDP-N-acetylmuramoyl-tripeptide--D-alanyl-D-alanine ligase